MYRIQEAKLAIDAAVAAHLEADLVTLLRGLIDLTYLSTDDDNAIDTLCTKANGVAAVCVYPQYITRVKNHLADKKIKIATVVNFPHGNDNIDSVLHEIDTAIALHADEIDVVLPYADFINGQFHEVNQFLSAVRKRCGDKVLKIIIESGVLQKPALIRLAGQMVIDSGADFIKTSTGKVAVGATLEATYTLLTLIEQSKNPAVGLKLSGGIKSVTDAHAYLYLARAVMGQEWLNPRTMRIGASRLVEDLP